MRDLSGWHQIACAESDTIRPNKHPRSSLTDMDGRFGEPIIYTEWEDDAGVPVLREYLWPKSARECEHWVPVTAWNPGGDAA